MAKEIQQLWLSGTIKDKERSEPSMPNQIKPDIELIIYNYIVNYPTHKLGRIANELATEGVIISPTGILVSIMS